MRGKIKQYKIGAFKKSSQSEGMERKKIHVYEKKHNLIRLFTVKKCEKEVNM